MKENNIKPDNLAKLFYFNKEFPNKPLSYGSVNLYQIGEVNYEHGYEGTHEQWCTEISIILSGTGIFTSGEKSYSVKERDIIINQNFGTHTIQVVKGPLRYFYLGFKFENVSDELRCVEEFFGQPMLTHKATDSYGLVDIFNKLLLEFASSQTQSTLMIRNYIEIILFQTFRTFKGATSLKINSYEQKNSSGATVYKVAKYVDNNIFSISDIRSIAANLNFSYEYLSHIFKKKTGISLQQYILLKKIEVSCKLIHENRLSLTEIAFMLNYESIQSFSKSFKNVMGVSPTAYKSQTEI